MHISLPEIIRTIGLAGVISIVFAESGLFFGFFLPGDSLLFTAGFLASQKVIDIWILAIGCFIAAVAGDSVGYWTGAKFGRKLFNKEDSFFFHKDHLTKAEKFYEKHGKKTIILARFTPIVRTFAPIAAGIAHMHYKDFLSYNIVGGFFWSIGLISLGYFLGSIIPDVDKYLLPIVVAIIVLSLLPSVKHVWDDPHHQAQIREKISKIFKK